MIRHTVVFSLLHDPSSDAERAFLKDARAALTSIPGVQDFTISRQVSPKSDVDYQFAMTFADEGAYAAYNEHPAHEAFVKRRWMPEVAHFQEFDFTALPA